MQHVGRDVCDAESHRRTYRGVLLMDWIKSWRSLRTSPKLKRVARRLEVPPAQAIGHLHCLWWWAVDHAPDGDLNQYDAEDLADAAEWDGDADRFVEVLRTCGAKGGPGFIDPDGFLNDWHVHQSPSDASSSGSYGNHRRWHVDRGKRADDCVWCTGEVVDIQGLPWDTSPRVAPESHPTRPDIAPTRPDDRPDIAPESLREERREREEVPPPEPPVDKPTVADITERAYLRAGGER